MNLQERALNSEILPEEVSRQVKEILISRKPIIIGNIVWQFAELEIRNEIRITLIRKRPPYVSISNGSVELRDHFVEEMVISEYTLAKMLNLIRE
jgi:hypothetical protein